MKNALKYADDNDKCLGIAGMAISLVAADAEQYLAAVSLEEGDDAISLDENFFFYGDQHVSAKTAWAEMLKQFNLTVGLALSNVLCRHTLTGRIPTSDVIDAIHNFIFEQGATQCSLDKDEIEDLYSREYSYYNRLFAHPTVASVARELASALRNRRHMTASEVLEYLRRLN